MIKRKLLRIIDRWQADPSRRRGRCIFEPTCSEFAREALEARSLAPAVGLIAWRVLRCNPYGAGGREHVPPARNGHIAKESPRP